MKLAAFRPELLPDWPRRNRFSIQRNNSRELDKRSATGKGSSNLSASRSVLTGKNRLSAVIRQSGGNALLVGGCRSVSCQSLNRCVFLMIGLFGQSQPTRTGHSSMSAYKDAALVLSTLNGTSLLIRSYIRSESQADAPARSWNWGC